MSRILAFAVAAVTAGALATAALADAVYHTAQVPLEPVGDAPGSGLVLNIHADGPNVYAHEIYLLTHAAPGTYEVTITIFPTSQDCTGTSVVLPTATLVTNEEGNGRAEHFFTPEDAAGLRGLTLSAYWTVSGPATYASTCGVVTLD